MAMPKRATTEKREEVPEKAQRRNVGPRRPVNPQQILDTTARLACSILKADIAAISLVDEEGYLKINSNVGMPE
ncbi:MAG TPA: hypothetical protein VIK32_00560, partial [Candidatus Limnocylindrales bacterium]